MRPQLTIGLSNGGVTSAPAPPAPELNPDPNFALGTSGWAASGGTVTINTGSVDLLASGAAQGFAPLAASANLTAFMAAVADSTTYVVRITVTNFIAGVVRCRLKGGTSVDLVDQGGGVWQGSVTSGTNAVFSASITGSGAVGSTFRITQFSIKAS